MQIIPGVYQITARGVNIILIAEEELTLVDVGFRGSSSKIVAYISRLGRSIKEVSLIIITHNHLDHVGGLPELLRLTTAKVAVHKADLSDSEDHLPYPGIIRKLLHVPPISLLRPLVYARPSQVDIQLKGGEVLNPLGGLRVIHTPGHTPGSISLFSPKKKLLIVGDTLNNHYIRMRLPPKSVSSDMPQAVDSIKQIARLDFETLCFGHGRPIIGHARARVQDLIRKQGL